MEVLNKTYKEKGAMLRLIKDHYANNGAVYLGLIEEDTQELYCDITINLNFSNKRTIELDFDFRNLCSKSLIKKVVSDLTTDYLVDDFSGFCSYPVYSLKEEYSN